MTTPAWRAPQPRYHDGFQTTLSLAGILAHADDWNRWTMRQLGEIRAMRVIPATLRAYRSIPLALCFHQSGMRLTVLAPHCVQPKRRLNHGSYYHQSIICFAEPQGVSLLRCHMRRSLLAAIFVICPGLVVLAQTTAPPLCAQGTWAVRSPRSASGWVCSNQTPSDDSSADSGSQAGSRRHAGGGSFGGAYGGANFGGGSPNQ